MKQSIFNTLDNTTENYIYQVGWIVIKNIPQRGKGFSFSNWIYTKDIIQYSTIQKCMCPK